MSTATDAPPEPPAEPPAADEGGPPGMGSRALAWLASVGNALVIPVLALFTALVIGGLVIIFTDPDTLDAWGSFFSDPGGALRASWDVVYEAYHALWESSLGSPQAIGRTLVEATPLARAGLSGALAFRAGLFNIGSASPGTCPRSSTCRSPSWPASPAGRRGARSPASSRPAPGPTK